MSLYWKGHDLLLYTVTYTNYVTNCINYFFLCNKNLRHRNLSSFISIPLYHLRANIYFKIYYIIRLGKPIRDKNRSTLHSDVGDIEDVTKFRLIFSHLFRPLQCLSVIKLEWKLSRKAFNNKYLI